MNPLQIMCDVTEKPKDEDPSNPVEQRLYRCTVNVVSKERMGGTSKQ